MSRDKFCVDCKHHIGPKEGELNFALGTAHDCNALVKKYNLVTGLEDTNGSDIRFCFAMRLEGMVCGPEGKLFERK